MTVIGEFPNLRLANYRLCVLLVFLLVTSTGCRRSTTMVDSPAASTVRVEYPITLVGPTADWRVQDYRDSQGIKSVTYDPNNQQLVLACELDGGVEFYTKGEILLPLKFVPTLECSVPVNMSERIIKIEVEIPGGFVGRRSAPNGCQPFVKDDKFRSQYGTWQNVDHGGTYVMHLRPSMQTPRWGYTDPGFDPTRIVIIGIKLGINSQSTDRYNGPVYVRKVEITPPLPFASPPELPDKELQPFLTGDAEITVTPEGFYVGNTKWTIVGGNWRVLEYGQTFGATPWFPKGNGVSEHLGFVAAKLQDFRRAGITWVRVGLLDDGRTMLDKEGKVTGFDEIFRNDVSNFLDLAARYNVKVEYALVDFLIGGKGEEVDGVWVRGRRKVIEDPELRQQFMTDFLEPFLDEFANHPALVSIDVINEPEWLLSEADGGGWETIKDATTKAGTPIPGDAMRLFISECIRKVRNKVAGKGVTVGVSSKYLPLVSGLDIDYRAVHYYPWMGDLDNSLASIPNDLPWILQEFPGRDEERPLAEYLRAAIEAGGAGGLLWNLSPDIDDQSYTCEQEEEKLQEIRSFIDSTVGNQEQSSIPSAQSVMPKVVEDHDVVGKKTVRQREGVYSCDKRGCPGHASPWHHCAYYCDKPGCPGHRSAHHHCAYYCGKAGCPGHKSPSDRCR